MNGKVKENIILAEKIAAKIKSDPTCDARHNFLQQFDAAE